MTAKNAKRPNSGSLHLRMSSDLHAGLAELAEREGVSLNTLINRRLERIVKRGAT